MEAEFYYYTLMLIPMLAGRSMVTIFSSAFFTYLNQQGLLPLFDIDVAAAGLLGNLPDWVTDPKFLIVTFILAILESRVGRSPSFQEIWALHEDKIKGAFAVIIAMALVDENATLLIQSVIASTGAESAVQMTWATLENGWACFIGICTWLLTKIRSSVMWFLMEVDQDDSLGIRKLIGRIEASLGVFGPLLFLVLPVAALGAAGFAIGIIAFLKWRVSKAEKDHSRPCSGCGESNHNSALHCASCNLVMEDVKDVGIFGLSKFDVPAEETKRHIQKLLEVKRCPYCASKSNSDALSSICSTCKRPLFNSETEARDFLTNVSKKLPLTLLVTAFCGFFPVIGLIPGIMFYRLYLIGPLKMYVGHGSSFFIRMALRIFFVFLIIFNTVPLFGFVSVPIMATANYFLYSNSIRKQFHKIKPIQDTEAATSTN